MNDLRSYNRLCLDRTIGYLKHSRTTAVILTRPPRSLAARMARGRPRYITAQPQNTTTTLIQWYFVEMLNSDTKILLFAI
jgi:hypothetical protein